MINLGQTGISNIYIGDTQVIKVFLCTDLVWPSIPPEPFYTQLILDGGDIIELKKIDDPVIRENDISEYRDSLVGVRIGQNIISIGVGAFDGCKSLTSVTISDSVTSIGNGAFDRCIQLTAVHISDIAAWCKIAFYNTPSNPLYYANNLYLNGALVTNLVIPDDVTSIGSNAFIGCTGLTSVTIGNSVTTIGDDAFYDCSSLTSITIPNSVTSIGERVFYHCSKLTTVTIDNGVTSIGDDAFYDCTGLTSITCEAITPPTCGTGAFDNTNGCIIHVPSQSIEAYKTSWSAYADRIEGYS